jgi:hypothetical protein
LTFVEFFLDSASDESNLQTDFDLLGELLKFNEQVKSQNMRNFLFLKGYQCLEECLDERQFNKFSSIIVTHIVDSNMFIRATLLSQENFVNGQVNKCTKRSVLNRF